MSATAQAQAAASSTARQVMSWATQGVESLVAVQKILMDLTAQQNSLVIGAIRERISFPEIGKSVVRTAGLGIEGLTAAGTILLELASAETSLLLDSLKDGLRLSAPASAAAEILRHRIDTVIGMQMRLLDAVSEHSRAGVESYEQGEGLNALEHMAAVARLAVEDFVATEKKFLDLVAKEVNVAMEDGAEPHGKTRARTKIISQLATESIDKYAEAQKKLVNLAIHQTEELTKMAEPAEPPTPLAEVAQNGIQNFIKAQKSLMDLALPKEGAAEEGEKPSPRPRRRTASKKATTTA